MEVQGPGRVLGSRDFRWVWASGFQGLGFRCSRRFGPGALLEFPLKGFLIGMYGVLDGFRALGLTALKGPYKGCTGLRV